MNKLIPVSIVSETPIDPERKVLYRKIHRYGKKEYLIEISRTKVKYYIISIRMGKTQKNQVQEFHYKQGKKMIRAAGGIEAWADRIKFKYGKLDVNEMNKLLHEEPKGKKLKDVAKRHHTTER